MVSIPPTKNCDLGDGLWHCFSHTNKYIYIIIYIYNHIYHYMCIYNMHICIYIIIYIT